MVHDALDLCLTNVFFHFQFNLNSVIFRREVKCQNVTLTNHSVYNETAHLSDL